MMGKTIFIGGGNIAEAIFAKLAPNNLIIVEHNEERIKYLVNKYPSLAVKMVMDYECSAHDFVILAIKPQNAKNSCLEIAKNITKANLISVMAGITISVLKLWISSDKITRAMPNTPCILNMGMTGIYFSPQIDDVTKDHINNIFKNIGITHIVNNEDDINKITAIASSSPAYVFYFIESLINSAVKNFGFTDTNATEITMQVLKGSLAMIEQNPNLPINTLRQNVTSKGGTTLAAINVLNENNLQEIISKTEIACYNRAIEIGNDYK